ncbi:MULTISPECIES: glutaminase A [Gordonia]|uniref:glutaminase A n=1 Tax=Gordonia TaxID=2053 RepID=UPI000BB86F66|nr:MULTISPECIES: glutaminase A [Gordonia]ATD69784.1 glutaminase A [Gordonia sp. 1D]MDJ0454222.1 glutaminase A [Gordonia amicalis]MDV7077917.1 glutaminase A [Gordonia amicalis]UOG21007.1 glutaminase A [Gordonia amicalis]
MRSPIDDYLHQVLRDCRDDDAGDVMSGNRELERADPSSFGIALATVDGTVYTAGDADHEFSMQSIAKLPAYALALRDRGLDGVLDRVDTEPSGDAFNEISLEAETGRPRNALINAGAIAVHGMLDGDGATERVDRIVDLMGTLAGRELSVDREVHSAELASDDHNTALAYLLRSAGKLDYEPDEVVDGYAAQCAIKVSCRDLAVMGSVLANGGLSTSDDERLLDGWITRHLLSVMATCGMYDGSGSWMATVGIPAKSGVSGAILGVLPGQVGVAVWSPRLDEQGNSVRGVAVFERLSRDMELHMMHVAPSGMPALRSVHERDGATVVEVQGDVRFAGAEIIASRACEGFSTDEVTLDLTHVRVMDDAARGLLREVARRLGDDHDVHIEDPNELMESGPDDRDTDDRDTNQPRA